MNKKFLMSWAVVFVIWMAGGFLIHAWWLDEIYQSLAGMSRPAAEQEALFPFMLLAHVFMAGAFVWIYQRGNEDKPWLQQGLRFGIAIALLAPIPTYMMYYAVQPTPGMLAIKQASGDGVLVIVIALVVAFLNRRSA